MKLGLRFFLSWILSAVSMFILFYLWHGVFLNDFKRIQFPLTWFVTFAAFSYLIIAAGMYFFFESRILKRLENIFLRALLVGVSFGFGLVMVATVVHISLTRNLTMDHLIINVVWQIGEQTFGVILMALLKLFIREPIQVEIRGDF